jgi:hypothetical protein
MELSTPEGTVVVSSRHFEATQMSYGQESHLNLTFFTPALIGSILITNRVCSVTEAEDL